METTEWKELRTALWGFHKQDVCAYITSLSEKLNAQLEEEREKRRQLEETGLAEQETRFAAQQEALQKELSRLREELDALRGSAAEQDAALARLTEEAAALRRENQALRADKVRIADVLLEANSFAKELREKAVTEDEDFRRRNRQTNEEVQERLSFCQTRVDQARRHIADLLRGMEGELSASSAQLDALRQAANTAAADAAPRG